MVKMEPPIKGQMEEGEVKGSKTVEESSDPASEDEFNPFLVEPVLAKLLKLVGEASQLKELRLMCVTWDEFNLKELEDRAFNGKIKAIDFSWRSKFRTTSEAEANLVQTRLAQFMEDTKAIPKLFSSFKFNFPESWTIFCKHMEFFSLYPVTFAVLDIPSWVLKLDLFGELLTKFLESDIGVNLKEITVSTIHQPEEIFGLPSSSLFVPASENMERKLQKLNIKPIFQYPNSPILGIFEFAFASGKYTNLTSMELSELPSGSLDFPGLDPSILTRLEIGQIGSGTSASLKFTSGLLNWARNGMKLKNLAMHSSSDLEPKPIPSEIEFFFEDLRLICSNLTQFLSSQSSTLESLAFKIICISEDPIDVPDGAEILCKIHLPKFEALHTLKLCVVFQLIEANPRKIHTQLFGMTHNPSVHFPKLVNLNLDGESSLIALNVNPVTDKAGQLNLERLDILDRDLYNIWITSFVGVIGSVRDLKCPSNLLYGERLPWGESLRSLYIYDINVRIDEQYILKLSHFKKLERLNIMYLASNDLQILAGYHSELGSSDVDDYLNTFKEATELPLTSIEFIGPNMSEEMKEKFIEYFPFLVQFNHF